MIEDTPNTVNLTPSHYVEKPTECWKRNGSEWKSADWNAKILIPEVYWWLRENVGYELNEVWDVDRYFYPDEERPELPKGHGGIWRAAGRVSFYESKHARSYYSHNTNSGGSIYFEDVRDARKFRARFALWTQSWALLTHAMRRRFASGQCDDAVQAIRESDRPLLAVAHHAFTGGKPPFQPHVSFSHHYYEEGGIQQTIHRFYLLFDFDEVEEMMFRVRHSSAAPLTFIAANAASSTPDRR